MNLAKISSEEKKSYCFLGMKLEKNDGKFYNSLHGHNLLSKNTIVFMRNKMFSFFITTI